MSLSSLVLAWGLERSQLCHFCSDSSFCALEWSGNDDPSWHTGFKWALFLLYFFPFGPSMMYEHPHTWWEPKSSSNFAEMHCAFQWNVVHFSEKRSTFHVVGHFTVHFSEMCCTFHCTFQWNALRISLTVHFSEMRSTFHCAFHWNAQLHEMHSTFHWNALKNMLFNRNLSFWFGLS